MGHVSLRAIHKQYDQQEVIRGLDLEVHDGEFLVFVGPSGCGKSTTLRMIAGLESITSGELLIDGLEATHIHPAQRGVAMVFQSYALYPHMTVGQNMAFSLKMAGVSKAEQDKQVRRAAEVLRIDHMLERLPKELSGGERQRVAIGRAIVRKPKVFLFDEPLSNLDAALRVNMRIELSRLHKELGTTMIYVTHDQSEALALSHEIAVMRSGRIMQIGTPRQIYEKPNSEFVADFVGTINFIKATVRSIDAASNTMVVDSEIGIVQVPMINDFHVGEEVQVCVRPEDVYLSDSTPPVNHTNHYLGTVFAKIFLGEVLDFQVQVNDKVMLARVHPSQKTPVGAPIHIVLDPSDCIVLKHQN
jgi:ABC-type sugar transport system ATPase subunit